MFIEKRFFDFIILKKSKISVYYNKMSL
jgi:hypothetical protein